MNLTHYGFKTAMSAFFEMETELASRLLPKHLHPLEVKHGSAIFAVTAFDFTDSMVGTYEEIVLAVIVPPLVQPGAAFPKSAFYPFLVGTSTEASRLHAIERWHLPHHMADVGVRFQEEEDRLQVAVHEGKSPILDLEIGAHMWHQADDLYQSFMIDGDRQFKVDIHMRGHFSEHEEETGSLILHPHAMTRELDPDAIETIPFRELWMKTGKQTFEELETLETV
ncbi:MAG: acetoacetate decarboxylase family protein [bacterium]